jgi:hypothetical protein
MAASLILKFRQRRLGFVCWPMGSAVPDYGKLQQDGEAARV